MSKSRFEVGQVVLYQNEDGMFVGKIKEVLIDHPEFEFLTKDSVDVTHLFGEDYCLEDVVVLKEREEKEGNKNE